jgi:hypothetical protein
MVLLVSMWYVAVSRVPRSRLIVVPSPQYVLSVYAA